ncbi:MAG: hypothetical protein DBX44_00360 [Oscillospiraceae bacterium]|nr:MAG: hypothetical protein DBX44_00360 [Oscillospiraceae bacterium]
MYKTLVLCDSVCDMSFEQEKKFGIRVVNCGVEMGGLPYVDRVEVDSARIYAEVERTGQLPHTSQVTALQFVEEYLQAAKEGYTDVICITMNARGSGTYAAALQAVELLSEEYPALRGRLKVHVVDSTTYSYVIAMPAVMAVERLRKGEAPADVAAWLQDWYRHSVTLVGLYSLQYAKKSGRLNACAALVGEVLGLKPVLSIAGENKMVAKVRGDRNLIPKMAQLYIEMAQDVKGDYIIAYGNNPEQGKELAAAIKKLSGRAPVFIGPIGPCVAINAGPRMLGIGFLRRDSQA